MPESCPAPQTARKPDPREVLDSFKRAKILALLEMGCSRRMAARQVDCAPSTITRTAERDEEFGDQIAHAEAQADIYALKLIRRTAQQERYWRVAAWILERRNPEEYGRRDPHTFTGTQVEELLLRALKEVVLSVAEEKLPDVMLHFHDILADVADKANLRPMELEELIAETMPIPDNEAESESSPKAAPEVAAKSAEKPSPKLAAAAARNGTSSPRNEPPPSRSAPLSNGRPASAAEPINSPRRESCLEQFVQRTPRPELQTAGT